MENNIQTTCPKCGFEYPIDINEKISEQIKQRENELNNQINDLKNQQENITIRIEEKLKEKYEKEKNDELIKKDDEYRRKLIERSSEERYIGKAQAIQELNEKYNIREKEKNEKHENEINELKLYIEKLTKRIEEASSQANKTPIYILKVN